MGVQELATGDVHSGRERFRQRHEALSLLSIWDLQEQLRTPKQKAVPFLWHWNDMEPLLKESTEHVTLHQTDRRAFIMANPGLFPHHATTPTLYMTYQIVLPGETAVVHRHTPSASRFVLQGTGGFTTIEGEKCPMSRGDLIVTPNYTWHDHGNDGSEPAIWIDVLDLPLVEHLGAIKFDLVYGELDSASGQRRPQDAQTVRDTGHSVRAYGSAGLMPTFIDHQRGEQSALGTPKYVYRWQDVRACLEELADNYEGSPYDGVKVEYQNPVTGGPLTPTMDFSMQMLRAGEETRAHRHTSSAVYTCLSGEGSTQVGDDVLEWGENDSFAVPSWAWHKHANANESDPAFLYCVSDAPTLESLGLFRDEVGE